MNIASDVWNYTTQARNLENGAFYYKEYFID
jgi:hypothetical protein